MKYILRLYFLSSFILFFSCVKNEITSTGNITGVIKDISTNQTLHGCLITLSPGGNSLSTGSDGIYSFNNLPPTSYSLEIGKEGYKAEKKEVTVIPGQTTKVDIFLTQNKPGLSITPESLDFGELTTSKNLFISNSINTGSIKYFIRTNADWIFLSSTEGTVSSTPNNIVVSIDRSLLSTGNYEKKLIITSQEGETEIPINVKQVENSVAKISIGNFSNITESSFDISGTLLSIGGIKITGYGHCWGESENPTIENSKNNLGDTQETGTFTSHISGLISGKTYFVRTYAINNMGIAYSNEQRVITMPIKNLPIVNTSEPIDISSKSANINGTILKDGNSKIIECGFYWGTNESTPIKQLISSSIRNFSYTLSGLTPNTEYYYKAFAKNELGTSYGDILSFKTLERSSIIYISSTGDDKNDGETWETAKENILSVLSTMTAEQEIWMKKGTYKSEYIQDKVANNIKIYGGFEGTESNINQRDFSNQTILQFHPASFVSGGVITGNNLIIDGVVIDGEKTAFSICGKNITIKNSIIRNFSGGIEIFSMQGKDGELIMKNSVIENCSYISVNHGNASFRFYDCTINAPLGYGKKYYLYRTILNGKYYEEDVIYNTQY